MKTKIVRIPRTSPLAKRFQAIRRRRQFQVCTPLSLPVSLSLTKLLTMYLFQEFNVFEDSPPPTKDPHIFDLDAFDTWIEAGRARHRERICISASKEQRMEFQLYEGLAVELHKLQKVKKCEEGHGKFFDVEVLARLLTSIEGDEFVRVNFTEPLMFSIGSSKLWDGDNDVGLG